MVLKLLPKDRIIRNIRDIDDLIEGLITAALSEVEPLQPNESEVCTLGRCSNQDGTAIPRPIEPELPQRPEPLIDILKDEKNGELNIIAEIPSFTKEDLKVEVAEGILRIQAERDGRRYFKEIPLEAEVDIKSSKVTYRNGVLDARLKLKEPKKVSGRELNVE